MAVYRGPACKLCRREGEKLFLKGDRCHTDKCAIERRNFIPGQHGQMRRRAGSEYGRQLREKQKAKRVYGIQEAQFRRYFRKAVTQKGVTGEALMRLLEMRLDNVVYRMGFAPSRRAARQLILHNHFTINGKKANIPSTALRVGDDVQVREKGKNLSVIHAALKTNAAREDAAWLAVDKVKLNGKVVSLPERDQMARNIQDQLIVELYSK